MATLSAVKHYMEDRRRATAEDVAIRLETTPEAAKGLLEMWRAKNRVRCIPGSCGSCGKGASGGCSCAASTIIPDVYEWVAEDV